MRDRAGNRLHLGRLKLPVQQMELSMECTIVGHFETRRDAEIAVEHLVQQHGVARTDIFIRAKGESNSSGVQAPGADIESGHGS